MPVVWAFKKQIHVDMGVDNAVSRIRDPNLFRRRPAYLRSLISTQQVRTLKSKNLQSFFLFTYKTGLRLLVIND